MLNLTACRVNRSDEQPFNPAAVMTAVGGALVQGPMGTVTPSTGTSGEQFVGVSLAQPMTLLNFPKVEVLIPPANAIVNLFAAPLAGTLRAIDSAAGTPITVGTPASVATNYSIAGSAVTLNAARVGVSTTFFYQFAPTTIQARLLQGDIQPGGAASLSTGSIGVIRAGLVFTTEYDTTVDWTVANPVIKTGANGRFTIGGSGALVPNAQVVQYPVGTSYAGNAKGSANPAATNDAFLGLYFSA
jgi:hypothetical protein